MARRTAARAEESRRTAGGYLARLKKRGEESHVYRKYQLLGLEIAGVLGDERHKSLYIKLAKEYGGERLLGLAKSVAERRDVRNRGAYFMALVKAESAPKKNAKRDIGNRQ